MDWVMESGDTNTYLMMWLVCTASIQRAGVTEVSRGSVIAGCYKLLERCCPVLADL